MSLIFEKIFKCWFQFRIRTEDVPVCNLKIDFMICKLDEYVTHATEFFLVSVFDNMTLNKFFKTIFTKLFVFLKLFHMMFVVVNC